MPPIDYTDYDQLSDRNVIEAQLIVTKRLEYYLKHIRGLLIFIAGATAVIGVKSYFELILLFN